MTSPPIADLLHLARRSWPPPGVDAGNPVGTSPETIRAFDARLGRELSASLRQWLLACDGALIGQGGVGLQTHRDVLDIEYRMEHSPWHGLKWVPIASDGCGSSYLELPTDQEGPVGRIGFIDCLSDQDRVTDYVAPRTDRFLWFMLRVNSATTTAGRSTALAC